MELEIEELLTYDLDQPICAVVWTVKDILHRANTTNMELNATQAAEILDLMDSGYTSLSWDDIDYMIEEVQ